MPGNASQHSKYNPNFHCMSSLQTGKLKTRAQVREEEAELWLHVCPTTLSGAPSTHYWSRLNKRFSRRESWLSRLFSTVLFRICTITVHMTIFVYFGILSEQINARTKGEIWLQAFIILKLTQNVCILFSVLSAKFWQCISIFWRIKICEPKLEMPLK